MLQNLLTKSSTFCFFKSMKPLTLKPPHWPFKYFFQIEIALKIILKFKSRLKYLPLFLNIYKRNNLALKKGFVQSSKKIDLISFCFFILPLLF